MSDNLRIPVLIIAGPVGVGKSSVASAVSEIFNDRSIPHACIDLDYLRYAYPRPKDDPFYSKLGMRNLASVWKNYQEVGIGCLILPSVIEHRSELEDYRKAIPGADIFIVGLHAPIKEIQRRLRGRENGQSLKWHLKRAAELSDIMKANRVGDVIIETSGKSIDAIAGLIINQWEQRGMPA